MVGHQMYNFNDELSKIKINKSKYIFILAYCILISFGLIYNNVHFLYVLLFFAGLIGFTIYYEKMENDLAIEKMKNHYVKSKISLKIDELEKSVQQSKDSSNRIMLESLLEEIELQNPANIKKVI